MPLIKKETINNVKNIHAVDELNMICTLLSIGLEYVDGEEQPELKTFIRCALDKADRLSMQTV